MRRNQADVWLTISPRATSLRGSESTPSLGTTSRSRRNLLRFVLGRDGDRIGVLSSLLTSMGYPALPGSRRCEPCDARFGLTIGCRPAGDLVAVWTNEHCAVPPESKGLGDVAGDGDERERCGGMVSAGRRRAIGDQRSR